MEKLLFIAFYYNHDNEIASKRLQGIAKYLLVGGGHGPAGRAAGDAGARARGVARGTGFHRFRQHLGTGDQIGRAHV